MDENLGFAYNLGFVFTLIICLDMSIAALWLVGRKEHLALFYTSPTSGRRRFKRNHGQRWWARRLWSVSCFLKSLLIYVVILGWMRQMGQ